MKLKIILFIVLIVITGCVSSNSACESKEPDTIVGYINIADFLIGEDARVETAKEVEDSEEVEFLVINPKDQIAKQGLLSINFIKFNKTQCEENLRTGIGNLDKVKYSSEDKGIISNENINGKDVYLIKKGISSTKAELGIYFCSNNGILVEYEYNGNDYPTPFFSENINDYELFKKYIDNFLC